MGHGLHEAKVGDTVVVSDHRRDRLGTVSKVSKTTITVEMTSPPGTVVFNKTGRERGSSRDTWYYYTAHLPLQSEVDKLKRVDECTSLRVAIACECNDIGASSYKYVMRGDVEVLKRVHGALLEVAASMRE